VEVIRQRVARRPPFVVLADREGFDIGAVVLDGENVATLAYGSRFDEEMFFARPLLVDESWARANGIDAPANAGVVEVERSAGLGYLKALTRVPRDGYSSAWLVDGDSLRV